MAISLGVPAPARSWEGESWETWLEGLLQAGVEALQVREKTLHDRDLWLLVRRLVERVRGRMLVLVNGRADIALAAGAQGVHLPATGLPASRLRERKELAGLLIGRSTHDEREVEAARREGCDYALFGPLRPTPSKPDREDLPLVAGLQRASLLGLPLLALGGVETPQDAEAAAAAGAWGVAAIRAFAAPESALALALRARELWPLGPTPEKTTGRRAPI